MCLAAVTVQECVSKMAALQLQTLSTDFSLFNRTLVSEFLAPKCNQAESQSQLVTFTSFTLTIKRLSQI